MTGVVRSKKPTNSADQAFDQMDLRAAPIGVASASRLAVA
jgi:hypothetical protein